MCNNTQGNLHVISWNVNSWTSENSKPWEQCIKKLNPDIILVIETKLKQGQTISLEGYVLEIQLKTAKCGSGGAGIFVKVDLPKEYELRELDINMEGLYFVSFIIVQLDIILVLCPCYLPPENSSWAIDSDLFFNHFLW